MTTTQFEVNETDPFGTRVEPAVNPETGPRLPRTQQEILGFNVAALQWVGNLAIGTGLVSHNLQPKLNALPQAAGLIGLATDVREGRQLSYEAVEPQIKAAASYSRVARVAERLGHNEHMREWMMGLLNEKLPEKVEKGFSSAKNRVEKTPNLESKVEHLASFENPREQFKQEMSSLSDRMYRSIVEQRDQRVASGVTTEVRPPAPKGIKGFFVSAYRKIKSFFGFFKSFGRRRQPNPNITAYDVGVAVDGLYNGLNTDHQEAAKQLPLVSKLIADKLPRYASLIDKDKLAFAAPEIVRFFASVSSDQAKWADLMDEVNQNPHEFRFVTRYKKFIRTSRGSLSLEGMQRAAANILPAIVAALPTDGSKIASAFGQVRSVLKPVVQEPTPVDMADERPQRVTLYGALKQVAKDRLKNVFSKHSKKNKAR